MWEKRSLFFWCGAPKVADRIVCGIFRVEPASLSEDRQEAVVVNCSGLCVYIEKVGVKRVKWAAEFPIRSLEAFGGNS